LSVCLKKDKDMKILQNPHLTDSSIKGHLWKTI